MFLEITSLIITFSILYFTYLYQKATNHFDKNGIKYLPGLPFFGNTLKSVFLRKHIVDELHELYNAFPDDKYVGFIEGFYPTIVVRDPELVKMITVKDSDHFRNRKVFLPEVVDPLLGGSIIMLQGKKWRKMRTKLTPIYTGLKLRRMMKYMLEISDNLVDYLKDYSSEDTDVDEVIRFYTNDTMACAGFGFNVNSFNNKNNMFYTSVTDTTNFTLFRTLYYLLVMQFSTLAEILKYFNLQVIPSKNSDFFRKIISLTIEERKNKKKQGDDFIHALVDMSDDNEWTTDEIMGQAYFAFMAGFETLSSTLVFCIHELAINPQAQEKLYQEIIKHKEVEGILTFDNIGGVEYLECVLNETSRKWSVAIAIDRVCTKAYDLPPSREGGKPYRVNPGDLIYSAANAIHMDPNYHPEPERFNPDRFLNENKHNINQFNFMPFGIGHRICLGARYATLMMKVVIYNLVLNFKILKSKKTSEPIELMPQLLMVRALGGSFVRFELRK